MDHTTSRDIDASRQYEKDLTTKLKTGDTLWSNLEGILDQIRQFCCNAILADYQAANEQNAENRLWNSHQHVNSHYRTALSQLKKSADRKVVEQRKLGAEYLKFIKSSQNFYRAFIGRLSAAYGNIPALHRVANKFDAAEQTRKGPRALGYPGPDELEQCCHRTLIRLGDLSRYREMELKDKEQDRDWAPAIGYYDLALTVCPGSGQPFNQRAIIAIAGRNLFRATYYAYRSLTAAEPHPQADDNLRRVMNMVLKASDKADLVSDVHATAGAALPSDLVAIFLRLLEQYSQGNVTAAGAALERALVTQLQQHVVREAGEPAPVKMVLTSIAAQFAAQTRLLNQPDSAKYRNAFVSFLELNMRLFTTFLQLFSDSFIERGSAVQEKPPATGSSLNLIDPVARRVLPVLRIYGSWLSKSSPLLAGDFVRDEVKADLWTSLASALSAVTATFDTNNLPSIEHLLEEDEETIGFQPLVDDQAGVPSIWYHDGVLKTRWHESNDQERDMSQEMLFRVKGFLVVGLSLAVNPDTPLKLDQASSRFTSHYTNSMGRTSGRPRVLARPTTHPNVPPPDQQPVGSVEHKPSAPKPPVTYENAEDMEAERMVQGLVGALEDDSEEGFCQPAITRFEPETPARPSMSNTTFGTASPFPVGSSTVHDVMARAGLGGSTSMRSGSGSRGGSQLQSPAMPPVLPRQHSHSSDRSANNVDMRSIWDAPQEAIQGRRTSSQALSPALATRSSPMHMQRTHSRGTSNELTPSIWSTNVANDAAALAKADAQPMSRSNSSRNLSNLGNGTFGTASPTGQDFQQTGTDYGWGSAASPSPANNPWSADYRSQKRLSAGSPRIPTSAQVSTSYGSSPDNRATPPTAYSAHAKAFKPSNLQHTTAQRMT